MTHPIVALQAALVQALRADEDLAELIGDAVFDAPPVGSSPPYVAIPRHDIVPRDGDDAPGHEHRMQLQIWVDQASRKAALLVAERVLTVALTAVLDDEALRVTHRLHERTDTAIDGATGFARAALTLRFFTEPA